jgi:hypothetical protein
VLKTLTQIGKRKELLTNYKNKFMPIPLLLGVGGVALAKRKQARKMQGAKNAFSKKYPLLEDVSSMEASISNAESELSKMKSAPTKNAAARRAQSLSVSALSSWIVTMKDQVRDLKAELSVATTSSSTVPTMPNTSVQTAQAPVVAGVAVENGENLAAPTVKKGVNWLLIGGLAVGGYLIYKLLKK